MSTVTKGREVHPWLLPALGALLLLAQAPFYTGYVTDDSYIYARFAENLALRGELAFNPGQPVHAATSPVWAMMGAVGVRLGLDAYTALHLLGVLFGAATCALMIRVLQRLALPPPVVVAAALVVATEPWLVRWSMSAMETALGTFLLAALLDATFRPLAEVRSTRAAWAAGLLPLVRPECVLLLGLLGVQVLRTPSLRRRAGVWIGALLPLVAWAALALPLYGHVFPATLQAKSTPLGLVPVRLLHNLLVLGALIGLAAAVPAVAWLSSLRWRVFWAPDSRAWVAPALWQWTVALPVVYLLRDVQVVSRYLEVILPVMVVLALHGARGFFHGRWGRKALLLQVALSLIVTVGWSGPSARAFGRSLSAGLGDIAVWLRTNSDPDALVAIYDIGLVGHRSDRRVLDLGGLVHPGINELRNRIDDATIQREGLFLRFERPDFFVDRDPEPDVLDGQKLGDVRLEAVLHRRVANLGLSRPDPVVYTLYRVRPVSDPP